MPYKWAIEHRCGDEGVVRDTLNDCGFVKDPDDDYLYKQKIRDWKTVEVRIQSKTVLQVECIWMGGETNEKYFDYLLHSGMKVGMFIALLEERIKHSEGLKIEDQSDPELLEDQREAGEEEEEEQEKGREGSEKGEGGEDVSEEGE